MKRIKLYIVFPVFIGLVLSSCDDWLYLEPENGVIREEFWNSKEDVFSAVMGCYASLLGNPGNEKGYSMPELLFIWGEIRGDMIVQSKKKSDFEYINNGDIRQDNNVCRWNAFYRTINYCNTVLEYADFAKEKDPSFTDQQLLQFKAEVTAMRALMYFYLVRTFDEVPLKLYATKSDNDERQLPKSKRKDIMNQIKSDLASAETDIPLSYGNTEEDKGRLTKYAVYAIQADVYLWNEQYDSCILACNKILNSGKYGLVDGDLNTWFSTLYGNGNSSEGIFEVQFSKLKLNPYYSMFINNRYFIASPVMMEELFPIDVMQPADSADIRGDGGAYKSNYGYALWKYLGWDRREIRDANESYANFIIYRYAEIILFKAEALAQLGFGDMALELVEQVRNRSNASGLNVFEGNTENINEISDYIMEERSREFAFEGKRWYDLLRNAKRNNYTRKDILVGAVLRSAPSDRQLTIIAKIQDTLSHYLPIYEGELNTNRILEQNSFYKN